MIIILNYQCFDTEFCLIALEKTIYNNLTRISQIIIFEQCGSKIKKQPSLKISTQFKNCNLVWKF